MTPVRVPKQTILFLLGLFMLLPGSAAATKRQSAVTASWRGAPSTVPLGGPVELVLHFDASADATVTAELLPSAGVDILSGTGPWTAAFSAGQTFDLSVTVRFTANGDLTLGARLIVQRPARSGTSALLGSDPDLTEMAGAALNVVAVNGIAMLSSGDHATMKIAAASTAESMRRLGIGSEPQGRPPVRLLPLIASTVSGKVEWVDPESRRHAVRRAYLVITDGTSGGVLTTTATSDTGTYSAAVNADSVQVTVYSRDFDNIRAVVFPLAQPTLRYTLQSAVTALTGPATTINITSNATVRGTPGAPSNDDINARGFAAYDAMLTFWFQTTAILGRDMQQAVTNFGGDPPCHTSCYSGATQQMYILREDAFDWDVLGHEFFHFATDRGALRILSTSLGGSHSGGSAIGQDDGTGHFRTRDEGMRLAWSEGLATFMSLAIQQSPPGAYLFPTTLLNIADSRYSDTEDLASGYGAESPPSNQGFGSENSVIGLLWDLFDAAADADGDAIDNTFSGVDSKLVWDAINIFLPCNPCDRVDKFWSSVVSYFGNTNPSTFDLAKLFVINQMAPKATAPADGLSVSGTVAPAFQWVRNGDPSADHRNNKFSLVFSRDDFRSHLVTIAVPTLDATSYTPTDAEWQSIQSGGSQGQIYKWVVSGGTSDAPIVPTASWYSNTRSLTPRALEATITWSPLGADVDLHLANPSGTDIAYYNRTTAWGFLDRDCITSCAQEVLSVTSLPLPGAYRLFAHYYSTHGLGAATVRAVVRSGSQILVDTTFVLGATGATYNIVSTTAKPEDGPTTPSSDGRLDSALLPPKVPEP